VIENGLDDMRLNADLRGMRRKAAPGIMWRPMRDYLAAVGLFDPLVEGFLVPGPTAERPLGVAEYQVAGLVFRCTTFWLCGDYFERGSGKRDQMRAFIF
jgi:hypothetical protein